MLKNIVIRGAREGAVNRRIGLALFIAVALAGCGKKRSKLQGSTMKTQIVVRWTGKGSGGLPFERIFDVQKKFDELGGKRGFDSDGNDVGGGCVNFYLYAADNQVESVVGEVVKLEESGSLPSGMQVGVAVYEDSARTNWNYRAAYPKDLKIFKLS